MRTFRHSTYGGFEMFDIILKDARVVDPINGVDRITDIAIEDDTIADIGVVDPTVSARRVIDCTGKVAVPGIIDPHVHLRESIAGVGAYRMVAQTGVTTAVDFAGPIDQIVPTIHEYGCGLQVAVLNGMYPGMNFPDNDPSVADIEEHIQKSLHQGAIGIKIIGGHYPLTPESTERTIETAERMQVYCALHVGTTEHLGDPQGVEEAVKLIGDKPIHIAHINSYCRGLDQPPLEEAKQILTLIAGKDRIVSESYLAKINGTTGRCESGVPVSRVTRTCLTQFGYDATERGLHSALNRGDAYLNAPHNGTNVLITGPEAADLWKTAETNLMVSFRVNDTEAQLHCAVTKDSTGDFIVDALSTDGGGIARNVLVEKGLLLVKLGTLTLQEFVLKSSYNAARMFGMVNKGHLGVGADADITVVDLEKGKAVLSIGLGEILMVDGVVVGREGTLLLPIQSRELMRAEPTKRRFVDLDESRLYCPPARE